MNTAQNRKIYIYKASFNSFNLSFWTVWVLAWYMIIGMQQCWLHIITWTIKPRDRSGVSSKFISLLGWMNSVLGQGLRKSSIYCIVMDKHLIPEEQTMHNVPGEYVTLTVMIAVSGTEIWTRCRPWSNSQHLLYLPYRHPPLISNRMHQNPCTYKVNLIFSFITLCLQTCC